MADINWKEIADERQDELRGACGVLNSRQYHDWEEGWEGRGGEWGREGETQREVEGRGEGGTFMCMCMGMCMCMCAYAYACARA